MTHTIHTTKHIDYSRGDRLDHLFVVDGDEGTAVLLTVSDTGLDLVLDSQSAGWRDRPRTKGFSLTWAEVIARVLSGEFDHGTWSTDSDVPPTSTTESGSTADGVDESIEDPRLCDCGKGDWCPLWGAWTGPGKTAWVARINNEEALTNG